MTSAHASSAPLEIAEVPALRGDAVRNRKLILAVARDAFRIEGLDVSMAEIARRSGVGIATLFRRFDSKERLIVEVFTEPMLECADAIDSAVNSGAGWDALESSIRGICALQVEDKGFAAVLARTFVADSAFSSATARIAQSFERIIELAKSERKLRQDFALDDLVALLVANAGLVTFPSIDVGRLSERLVTNVLRSLQTH